jgi:hypothetical protein
VKNLNGKEIAAIAHVTILVLSLAGVITTANTAGAEAALTAGITAGVGLVSSAAVFWKYIHHHAD